MSTEWTVSELKKLIVNKVNTWPIVEKGLGENVLDGEGIIVLNPITEDIDFTPLKGTGLDPEYKGEFRVRLGGQHIPVRIPALSANTAEVITDANGVERWSFRIRNAFARQMLTEKNYKPIMKEKAFMPQFFRALSTQTSKMFEDGFRKRKTGTLGFQWVCGASSMAAPGEIYLDIEVAYKMLIGMKHVLPAGSELRAEWSQLLKQKGARKNLHRHQMIRVASLLNGTEILIQRHPTSGANGTEKVTLYVVDLETPFVVMNHETAKSLLGDFDGDGYFFSFGLNILSVDDTVTRILNTPEELRIKGLKAPYADMEFEDTGFGLSHTFYEGHFEGEPGHSVIPFSSVLGGEAKISVGPFKSEMYWVMEGVYQATVSERESLIIAEKVLLSPHWGGDVPEHVDDLQNITVWGESTDKAANRRAIWKQYASYIEDPTWEGLAALKKATWYGCYYGIEEFLMDASKFKVKLKGTSIVVVPELTFDVVAFLNAVREGLADLSELEDQGFCIYPLKAAMENSFVPAKEGLKFRPRGVLAELRPAYYNLIVQKSQWQDWWNEDTNNTIHRQMLNTDVTEFWNQMVAPPTEWQHRVHNYTGSYRVGEPNLGYVPGDVKDTADFADIPSSLLSEIVYFQKKTAEFGNSLAVTAPNGKDIWLEFRDDEMVLHYNGENLTLDKIYLTKNTVGINDANGWVFVSRQGTEYFYNWKVVDESTLLGEIDNPLRLVKLNPHAWLGWTIWSLITQDFSISRKFNEEAHTSIVLERLSKELRTRIMKLPRITKGDSVAKAYLGEFVSIDTSYKFATLDRGKVKFVNDQVRALSIRREIYLALEKLGYDLRMTKHAERGDRIGRKNKGWDALSGAFMWPQIVNHNRKSKLDSILVGRRAFAETNLDSLWTNKFGDRAAKSVTVALVSWVGFGSPDSPCDETYRTYHGDVTLATDQMEFTPVSDEEYNAWLATDPEESLIEIAKKKSVDVPCVHREGYFFKKRVIPTSLPGVTRTARKLAIGYRPGINQPFPYDIVASHTPIKEGEDWRKRLTAKGKQKVLMVDILDSVWAMAKKAAMDQKVEMANSLLNTPFENMGQSADEIISKARSEETIRIYQEAKKTGKFSKVAGKYDDMVSKIQAQLKKEGKDPEGLMHLYMIEYRPEGETIVYKGKHSVGSRVCYRPNYEQGWGSYGSICDDGVTMDMHMRVLSGEGITITPKEMADFLFHRYQWHIMSKCIDRAAKKPRF